MKTIKQNLKVFAVFLSALMLFQGCTVYRSSNVTPEEAVKAETKVRVIKRNGDKVKYFRIVFEDGQYKYIKKLRGASIKNQIDIDNIEKVQVKNKRLINDYIRRHTFNFNRVNSLGGSSRFSRVWLSLKLDNFQMASKFVGLQTLKKNTNDNSHLTKHHHRTLKPSNWSICKA